jgi:hypothetical protein
MAAGFAKPLRVLLVQLPLLDPGLTSARANVPLAGGYLAAFARSKLGPAARVDLLPDSLARGGGDAAVLAFAARFGYDVVGFTAYLWNLERSLDLARAVKRAGRALVVMGGPEIVPGRRLLENEAVDVFVCGEGEEAFAEILRLAAEGEKIPKVVFAPDGRGPLLFPNPYLAGALGVSAGKTLHLETMRGCARRCGYCYYAKARPAPRYFPEGPVAEFFALAAERKAGAIYVMDPSFERRPRVDSFLRRLAAWNVGRIPLHTEMCLESVTPERAALLKEAGFVSVEAGLQSTNPRALEAVHRTWNRDRFLRGADLLRRRGIEVRTGIILGLPEDTLGDFAATLDFVKAHGLDTGAEIYPLSLLPGSDLAARAAALGIEAMSLPPYWVLAHPSFTVEDFFRAEELVREKLDRSLFEQPRPHFEPAADGMISFCALENETDAQRLLEDMGRIGNSLTLLANDAVFRDRASLARLAARLKERNPHTLLQIVVRTDRPVGDDEARAASDLFFAPGAFLDRCHAFDDDVQGRFSVRLFALVSRPELERAYAARGSFIDPILECRPGLAKAEAAYLAAERPLLLIPRDISSDEQNEIASFYSDTPESLLYYGSESRP